MSLCSVTITRWRELGIATGPVTRVLTWTLYSRGYLEMTLLLHDVELTYTDVTELLTRRSSEPRPQRPVSRTDPTSRHTSRFSGFDLAYSCSECIRACLRSCRSP